MGKLYGIGQVGKDENVYYKYERNIIEVVFTQEAYGFKMLQRGLKCTCGLSGRSILDYRYRECMKYWNY